ncbi:MAG: hypothetical protein IJL47_03265 [Lachnospiraceae bacterium]|nr:hypothetical protein [Lachnospiraceae bacterium]
MLSEKKTIRLRSIYFPFYAFICFNWKAFLPMLPINLAVTALLLFLTLHFSKASDVKGTLKKTVLPSFLYGLLADLCGVVFRFLPLLLEKLTGALGWIGISDYLGKYWSDVVLFNIYMNHQERSLTWIALSIVLSGFLVFVFNYHFALKKGIPDGKLRKRCSIILAVVTAPYSFSNPFM